MKQLHHCRARTKSGRTRITRCYDCQGADRPLLGLTVGKPLDLILQLLDPDVQGFHSLIHFGAHLLQLLRLGLHRSS